MTDLLQTYPNREPVDPRAMIAGFWRRSLAFIADAIILAIPLALIGEVARDQLSAMPHYSGVIGLAAMVLYFTLLQSTIGGGRTLGQRMLNVRVVDSDGRMLAPLNALIRAVVFCLPIALSSPAVPAPDATMGQMIAFSSMTMLAGGIQLCNIYLFLFNRATRQTLYDVVVNAYVVDRDFDTSFSPAPMPRRHIVLSGIIALLIVGLTVASAVMYKPREAQDPVAIAYHEIKSLPDVLSVQLLQDSAEEGDAIGYLIRLRHDHMKDEAKLNDLTGQIHAILARNVLETHPSVTIRFMELVDLVLYRPSVVNDRKIIRNAAAAEPERPSKMVPKTE